MKIYILYLVSFFFSFIAIGGEELYTHREDGTNLTTSTVFELYDDEYFAMESNPLWSTNFINASVKNYVKIGIDPEAMVSQDINGTVSLDIEYKTWNANTGVFVLHTETKVLSLDFDGTDGYLVAEDISTYIFTDAHWIKVSVNTTGTTLSAAELTKLYVESGIEVDRYYDFSNPDISDYGYTFSGINNSDIEIRWTYHKGAESYELEWVHINDYTILVNGAIPTTNLFYNFYLNSTRIETLNNHYSFPNIFDRGYIVYRVRPVGRDSQTGERIEGNWTSGESGSISSFAPTLLITISGEYDEKMNWAHQAAYAEEGKRFEGVSFNDGLGRARQSVVKNSENGQVIVSNVYFDELGRAVISDLPSPLESDYLRHFPNYNRPETASTDPNDPLSYMYLYFDGDSPLDPCIPESAGFSDQYGSGKYYSANNSNQDGANANIPDAEHFPFTRVVYRDDLTGRVSSVSPAGETLAQGQGHETKMFYSAVSQGELNKLFGVESGYRGHYQKKTTVDGNGQIYVQITDMAGRVVASYMEGASPNNLTSLNTNTAIAQPEAILSTVDEQTLSSNPPTAEFVFPLTITEEDDYLITYDMTPEQYHSLCNPTNICFDCVYDLEIKIVGPCEEVYSNTLTINGTALDDICNGAFTQLSLTEHLEVGEYTLYKKLSVNQDAIDTYWCFYFDDNSCITTAQQEFEILYIAEPFTDCSVGYDFGLSTGGACGPYADLMRMDMKPGGQYATYTLSGGVYSPSSSLYSIFNTNTELNLPGIWYTLSFMGENGQPDPVLSNYANYTESELIEYFINNFRNDWATLLLSYHPEICYLTYCENNNSSHAYDDAMNQISSFQTALSQGYFQPLNFITPASYSASALFSTTATNNIDPYFLNNGTYTTDMTNAMNVYISIYDNATSQTIDLSMWQYAVYLANGCASSGILNCIGDGGAPGCEEDLIWIHFRSLYLEKKTELFYQAQTAYALANCTDPNVACIGANPPCSAPEDALASHTSIWSFQNTFSNFSSIPTTQLLDFFGIDVNGNPVANNSGVGSSCNMICNDFADNIIAELANCIDGSTDVAQLKLDLIDLCLDGCSAQNLTGYTTNPSETNSVELIMSSYFGSESPSCTDLLISSAGPYQAPPNQSMFTDKLDTCGCDFLYEAKNNYLNAIANGTIPAGINDLEQWIMAEEGIGILDVDVLLCACDVYMNSSTGIYSNTNINGLGVHPLAGYLPIPHTYDIPLEISCRGDNGCIDCSELITLMTQLNDRFAGPNNPNYDLSTKPNYEIILTNYLNNETNFDFEYQTYLQFILNCNASPSEPYCQLNPMMLQWQDMMNVILMRGKFMDGISGYDLLAENIVYENSDLKIETLSEFYASSITGDVLTTTYTGVNGACNFTFELPTGATFGFEDITFIRSIIPTGSSCSGNNQFDLEVEYYECGVKTMVYLRCTSSCMEVNICGCGVATLCPDSEKEDFVPCYQPRLDELFGIAIDEYEENILDQYAIFKDEYNAQCATAFETEEIIIWEKHNIYQKTLFFYDQAGNLTKTIAPKGVEELPNSSNANINTARNAVISVNSAPAPPTGTKTVHKYNTEYSYNSYNQLVNTTNPDQEGANTYWYDRFGRIAISQNPVQADDNQYAYSYYDQYGRPIEVGIVETTTVPLDSDLKDPDCVNLIRSWQLSGNRTEVTITHYDKPFYLVNQTKFEAGAQQNLRLRVASVYYYATLTSGQQGELLYETATHYSYDPHGNVIEQLQDVRSLQIVDQDIKSTQYEFELISGNVKEVQYQKDKIDQMTHSYKYDNLNRLTEVHTSTDKIHKTRQAHYRYFDYGPLSRVELGKNKVQGMDFAYTINGWLKGMNSSFLDYNMDMGKDGKSGYANNNTQVHDLFAKDVVAYTLGYFDNDYTPIDVNSQLEGHTYPAATSLTFSSASPGLYNGNIRNYVSSIYNLSTIGVAYQYDQLNRLKQAQYYYHSSSDPNDGFSSTAEYFNSYSYDENGNITNLKRNSTVAIGLEMDDFTYKYFGYDGLPLHPAPSASVSPNNRLDYVIDFAANDAANSGDIKAFMLPSNYAYDKLGQLTKDVTENIDEIEWRKGDKKMKKMTRGTVGNESQLEFVYNPFGQRVLKIDKPTASGVPQGQETWKYTYYTYDANGQVMAVYNINLGNQTKLVILDEQHIYGASRLGMIKPNISLYDDENSPALVVYSPQSIQSNEVGKTYYEINNYLGNVNAVITDRHTIATPAPGVSTWEAVVISNADYYPFGMLMPDRSNSYASVDYRYAYNGMELDNSVSGTGNSYTTEFRQYDPRLARWKSLDPLMTMFPGMSPYNAFDNNPIIFTDPLGLASEVMPHGTGGKDKNRNRANEGGGAGDKGVHDLPEFKMKANRINKGYYENNKGFVIEKKAGGAPYGGSYLGNQKPSNVNQYHMLIFKNNKLVHKHVHNQAIVLFNYLMDTDYTTNKDYNSAEESFNGALVEFTTEWAVGFGLGKLFKGSKWLWRAMKKRGGSLWGGGIGRGFVFEEMIGANLRHIKGYNVIDDFVKGVATSVKTIKLTTNGYINNPKRVYYKLKGYVDELVKFNGVNKGGVNTINKITSRKIELAIPKNATKEQIKMIEKAVKYAQDKGVTLNVRAIR